MKVAVDLAESLCDFPQECMKVDRESSYKATYGAASLEEALKMEFENGAYVLPEAMKGEMLLVLLIKFFIYFQLSIEIC